MTVILFFSRILPFRSKCIQSLSWPWQIHSSTRFPTRKIHFISKVETKIIDKHNWVEKIVKNFIVEIAIQLATYYYWFHSWWEWTSLAHCDVNVRSHTNLKINELVKIAKLSNRQRTLISFSKVIERLGFNKNTTCALCTWGMRKHINVAYLMNRFHNFFQILELQRLVKSDAGITFRIRQINRGQREKQFWNKQTKKNSIKLIAQQTVEQYNRNLSTTTQ